MRTDYITILIYSVHKLRHPPLPFKGFSPTHLRRTSIDEFHVQNGIVVEDSTFSYRFPADYLLYKAFRI